MISHAVRRFLVVMALALGGGGALLLGANGLFAAESSGGPVAEVEIFSSQIVFHPVVAHDSIRLNVSGPGDLNGTNVFPAGTSPTFVAASNPDGQYIYELLVIPRLNSAARQRIDTADPEQRDALYRELIATGEIPETVQIQSGGFTIQGGSMVGSSVTSTSGDQDTMSIRDQVIADDLIVQSSLCVGIDCVNGEVFGFDTIRLKENNLRIKFEDTSTGSFPSTDWQLTANDSANGGANRFSIEDVTAATNPFTIQGAAPTNSLVIEATSGDIGIGTGTPALQLHVADGNTPALRLDQTTASGFTAQTWDVAGNEANFFVRDITNSSRLPFRIRPGAPTSSIDISAAGDVGMGFENTPAAQLEVRSNTDQVAKFTNQSDQTSAVQISVVQDTVDEPKVEFITPLGNWAIGIDDATNSMVFQQASTDILSINRDTNEAVFAGSVTANGGVMHASDADRKEEFVDVDTEALLQQALELRIASWQYKTDANGTRHIGPTAQDFAASFGVGSDDRYINTVDADGVTLGAIQGLNARLIKALDERDARIAGLEARIAALEANK